MIDNEKKVKKILNNIRRNYKFTDSALLNDMTYFDYLERFKRVALSIFEWVNLPSSMNAEFLEKSLYYTGQCAFLYDEKYGFLNTKCSSNGNINLYNLPTYLNCFGNNYQSNRRTYMGFTNNKTKLDDCILVMNNWDRLPTYQSMELFALRLTNTQRTIDVNINAQRTPILLIADERQKLLLENVYNQYNGNSPVIFGDKNQLTEEIIKAIKTDAPYIEDKLTTYKKEIWNEALTYLGINNIVIDKKERLITDEANGNNELINLNLQSMLAPRQKACNQFNEKFNMPNDKKISVRVRSDLANIIKKEESIVTDYNNQNIVEGE